MKRKELGVARRAGEAVNAEELREKLVRLGVEPASNTPAEFAKFIQDQLDLHRKVVKEQA